MSSIPMQAVDAHPRSVQKTAFLSASESLLSGVNGGWPQLFRRSNIENWIKAKTIRDEDADTYSSKNKLKPLL